VDDLKLNKILWIASGYALVVAALYLWGYWESFGLNFLEYIGFGDMLRYALIPFLISMASVALGFTFSAIRNDDRLPPGGGADTSIGRFGRQYWRPLVELYLVTTVAIALFGPEPWRWYLVAVLLMWLTVVLTHLDYFINLMPNPRVRANILQFGVFIAAMAFAQGRFEAYLVLRGRGPLLVDVVDSGVQLQSSEDHPVSYLGHLADFFVLYESARSHLVVLNQQKLNSLVLLQNPKAGFLSSADFLPHGAPTFGH
jgi:hypothetical protein